MRERLVIESSPTGGSMVTVQVGDARTVKTFYTSRDRFEFTGDPLRAEHIISNYRNYELTKIVRMA